MNNKVRRCRGVTRFDGRTTTTYLDDHCVQSLSISPDGSVWLRANEAGRNGRRSQQAPFHTYVITPAAATDPSVADDEAVGRRNDPTFFSPGREPWTGVVLPGQIPLAPAK